MNSGHRRFVRMGVLFPLFLMVLTTIYLAAAFDIRTQFAAGGFVGPRTIPVLAAVLMYCFLAIALFNELREGPGEEQRADFLRPCLVLVATAAYIFCFRPLGYAVATALYVAALFLIFRFETDRPLRFLFYVALVTVIFYGLFAGVFGVRLPTLLGAYI